MAARGVPARSVVKPLDHEPGKRDHREHQRAVSQSTRVVPGQLIVLLKEEEQKKFSFLLKIELLTTSTVRKTSF